MYKSHARAHLTYFHESFVFLSPKEKFQLVSYILNNEISLDHKMF